MFSCRWNLAKLAVLGFQEELAGLWIQNWDITKRHLKSGSSDNRREFLHILHGRIVNERDHKEREGVLSAWHISHRGDQVSACLRELSVVSRWFHPQLLWKCWWKDNRQVLLCLRRQDKWPCGSFCIRSDGAKLRARLPRQDYKSASGRQVDIHSQVGLGMHSTKSGIGDDSQALPSCWLRLEERRSGLFGVNSRFLSCHVEFRRHSD